MEPPDEVVPQPEDFFIVMIIIIIVNNTILNTITNKENKTGPVTVDIHWS